MKRILATVVALGLSAAALVGVPAQAAGKTLTLGVIGTLNDYQASSAQYANLGPFFQAVYSPLLVQSADGHTLKAGLATAWKYDKTNTVLTLTLRKGVKFTNGEAFNAAAVKKNLEAYAVGAASDAATKSAAVSTITAKGTDTVIIKLKQPSATYLTYLSSTYGLQQAPSTIGTADAKSSPIGCGPYILDKANTVAGATYVYTANPTYWDKANRKFDALTIKVIVNSTAAVNAIKAGDVDAIPILDYSSADSLKAAGLTLGTQYLNWIGFTFVDKSGRMGTPLKYLKVRQAINYAIDRDAALKVFANGYGETTQQVFAKYNLGYDASLNNTYTYNVDKAKALMAEAGYANGFTLNMPLYAASPAAQGAFIADQLSKIGITVNYTTHATLPDFFGSMWAPKYPMYRMTLERNSSDLVLIDFLLDREAAWNPSGYGDATSDKLIATARTTTGAKQVAAFKALNKYITQQAWFAPMAAPQVLFAYNPAKLKVSIHNGNSMPYLGDISAK